ncbi:hypothetical protein C8F01DRAFT_1147331 [Mycena amicta]|nr:hypothetical protein C8F01DRAFT_1147331 [Mycena amicta]
MTDAHTLRLRLEEIDAETTFLHTKIAELAAARRVVVEQLKRVTYPVLELPVEIACKIFLEYTQDEAIDVAREQLTGPFVLARICKRWRTIALGLHELWTRIYVCDSTTQVVKERLKLCLERSGPLADLELDFEDPRTPQEIICLLLPTASRWSRLDFFMDDTEALKEISGCLMRLQVLKLYTSGSVWQANALPVAAFLEAPMLRKVELFSLDASMVSLPWAQMSTLSLHPGRRIHCDGYLAMLRQTRNLETLHLWIPEGGPPSDSAILELRLERLRNLTFQWESSNRLAAVAFASLLTLPALVDLTTDIHSDANVAIALRDMLARSERGEMRSLALKLGGENASHISIILGAFVTNLVRIDKLTIAEVGWDQLGRLFDALGYLLAPFTEVRDLSIEMIPGDIPYSNLARLVNNKGNADRPDLRRLEFSIPPPREIQTEVFSAVERLRRVAASPGGPRISINSFRNSFVIDSDSRLPPSVHTLSDS